MPTAVREKDASWKPKSKSLLKAQMNALQVLPEFRSEVGWEGSEACQTEGELLSKNEVPVEPGYT